MKRIFAILLFIFLPVCIFAQETPLFNIGAGMPIFFNRNFDAHSGGTHFISFKRGNLFVEYPGLFYFTKNRIFNVTPGITYFTFNEYESGGGNGGGSSKKYKHQAVGPYIKLVFERHSNSLKHKWYLGFVTGTYFYTNTTGNESWWTLQQDGQISGLKNVSRSGKSFFNSFYYGYYAGFRPIIKLLPILEPAIEFYFLPDYATIIDSYLPFEEQKSGKSMALVSLVLGFGSKGN